MTFLTYAVLLNYLLLLYSRKFPISTPFSLSPSLFFSLALYIYIYI